MSLSLKITRDPRIPLRLRKKLGRLTRVPRDEDFAIDVFGHKYIGKTDTRLDRKVYQYGLYDPSTLRLIRKLLRYCKKNNKPTVYVDVGSNTGLHILAAADLTERAYGFEPWEPARKHADDNLKANNITHAEIFPFGLSDKDAMLPFRPPVEGDPGSGSFLNANGVSDLQLEVRAGDSFFEQQGIRPSIIKIDVEGYEKKVLHGLAATIKKYRPFVIFEYGSLSRKDFRTDRTLSAVFDIGYSYYGIRRSRETPELVPFDPRKKWENVLATPVSFENIKAQMFGTGSL